MVNFRGSLGTAVSEDSLVDGERALKQFLRFVKASLVVIDRRQRVQTFSNVGVVLARADALGLSAPSRQIVSARE